MEVDAEPSQWKAPNTEQLPSHKGTRAGLRRIRNLLVIYWLAMFVGSHVKLNEPAIVFNIRDKVLHFAAYAGLAFLAAFYLRLKRGSAGWLELGMIWLLAIGYGALDEVTQIPVGRTADPLDWLADVAGAAAGIVAFLVVRRVLLVDRAAEPHRR